MYFIDRLFMQQTHPEGGLPLVGTHVIERLDMETGEALPPSVNQKRLEGSFSTKLNVRCDGFKVRVEGNPSRWQRMDNLFGLTTIEECVSIYNHILERYGLPPFTKNTRLSHRQTPDGKSSTLVGNGAEITAIDWTQNLSVGKGREDSFIRGMSSMQIGNGRKPHLFPNGKSCGWGYGSHWRIDVIYQKAFELKEHLKKDKRKKSGVTDTQLEYIEKLISYCENQGVVRQEHKLQQLLLKRHNLQFYGIVTEQDYYPHLNDIDNAMKTIQISHDEHVSIAQQLLDVGAVDTLRKANTTMNYFTIWQNGTDLRQVLNRSQFYEHKTRLKKIGIDIGQVFDVSRLCPTLRRSDVIEVKPLQVPDWYQHPVVAKSNVMPFRAIA
ncbi:phage/plasmid replication protein, II/X family [Vibrio furnissii]|uniref:phage/plasmid replication protein, II/X family n=1 Tax=Vibrio furnissii TaxID=29494 RepID=UPI001C9E14C9|nr:phage/plasmid replication protein, II/X family [Vibrio furnissii]MBY7781097.1 phage/plasmid replication protein, II/X family [Vibrio fluvialis]MBY7814393.1 phage/plasmid replication protein, II/X family [Vibrio fluvialis]UHJ61757.1 phage/plasmid replication protein, II/X family [Vibrio furnissii]UHJ61758.1 phage/plasmid replication protein, II/X family [Vibrio furnissii]